MVLTRLGAHAGATLLSLGVVLGASVAPARVSTSLFQTLSGIWNGAGRVVDNQNRTETIRCRVSYAVSSDTTSLNQTLTCASASYKFDVAGSLVNHDGAISGQWQEKSRGVSGQVTGTVAGSSLITNVSGPGFSAQLNVVMRGATQNVVIRPQGADVKEITIALRR